MNKTACVPVSVSWSSDPDILNGVYMSEALNDVFISNFQKDPTLTWQFFGSSTGFFRLYPGTLRDYRDTYRLVLKAFITIFHIPSLLYSCCDPFSPPLGIKWTPDPNGVVEFDCRNRNW